ncbi:MAG: hypothetical protein PHW60_01780 [Kiritimatiellae bacterium]|nr:hypothetical protein [Kiritimatiellia bacterium]
MKSRSESAVSIIFLPRLARKKNYGKDLGFAGLFRVVMRVSRAKEVIILAGLLLAMNVPAQTPYYYLNRSFSSVQFDLKGIPTEYLLNEESDKLTDIINGSIQVNSNAIEKQAAIPVCYGSAMSAWIAAVNYTGATSNYSGKIFDNVGWVRGTKSVNGKWGAYLWVLQNQIAFRASTSAWWSTTNGIPVAISNVMVGSLGDYPPMSNVVDIGPVIPTNFLGPNQNDSGTYQVDITNVYYELIIPDIWIMPREAMTFVGGSNVQYSVTGTNIPQGVNWSLIPDLSGSGGAEILSNGAWRTEIMPENVGTNYIVRATSKVYTNFCDQVSLTVLNVDIVETNIYVGATNTVTLHLTADSYLGNGTADWSSQPSGISGSGTAITFSCSSLTPTTYVVRAQSSLLTNCYDTCTVTVMKVDIVESNVYAGTTNSVTLHLTADSYLGNGTANWSSEPSGISGSGTAITFNCSGLAATTYVVKAQSSLLEDCCDTCLVTVVKVEVTNIKFNWDTASSSNDAINIRQDYSTPYDISAGEWVKSGANIAVCYTANCAVAIKTVLSVQPASITSANVRAVSAGTGGSLGDVIETNVIFISGVASDVLFQISGTTPNCVKKTTVDIWQWKAANVNGSGSSEWDLNSSGAHTVYTILAEPVSPWDNTEGSQQNAWTKVLDYSCNWAATATDETNVVANITTGAYSGFGKRYDGYQSHTIYNSMCHLSAMMSTNVVDCRDMSAVVELFSRILGGVTVQVRRVNDGLYDEPFHCKPMLPIGCSTWVTNGIWNFHQFGWHANSVNDACVKLKESAPYVPVHDDLNGNYKTNLYDNIGTWNPLNPNTVTDFD